MCNTSFGGQMRTETDRLVSHCIFIAPTFPPHSAGGVTNERISHDSRCTVTLYLVMRNLRVLLMKILEQCWDIRGIN